MCQLDRTATKQLLGALQSTVVEDDPDTMAEKISKSVPSIPLSDLKTLLQALYELYSVRDSRQWGVDFFVDELVEGLIESRELPLDSKKGEKKRVRSLFDQLLRINALALVTKADVLQKNNERLFCCVRIISDIRPLFGEEVGAAPDGAVVTHSLKIGFHKGDSLQHEEIYVALDASDLQELGEVVDRAKKKDRVLNDFLMKHAIPRLGN